jgi:hypothetical protein
MNEYVEMVASYIHLVNLAVALYIIKELLGLLQSGKKVAFSKSLKLALGVAVLFVAVELLQLAGTIAPDVFVLAESLFVFILLVLLLQHYLDMGKSLKVHEHLVKRKFRGRLRDVE